MIADLHEAYSVPWIAVDWETNAKDVRYDPDFKALGVSIAFRNTLGVMCSQYYAFNHWDENDPIELQAKVREVIENHPCVIMHNAKFDLMVMKRLGWELKGTWYDTMLMAHWINENLWSKELDWLGKRFIGRGKQRDEIDAIVKAYGWGLLPANLTRKYGTVDAEITFDLFFKFLPQFQNEGYDGPLWERERKFLELIQRMESIGVYVDTGYCEQMIDTGETELARLLSTIGFNPMSNPQLGAFLINKMGLPVIKKTPAGKPSFDKYAMEEYEEILEQRNDDTARNILAYRGWQKTISSNYKAYLKLLSKDGRLRPGFLLHGTRTGRLSCREPNLQQIPKSSEKVWNGGLRNAFHGDQGCDLIGFDYSNLELRLASIYAKETTLLDSFRRGLKPFDIMAKQLGWPRDRCKTLTYAILYGAGLTRIHNIFGVSYEEARELRDTRFFGTYPNLRNVIQYSSNLARNRGYVSLWTERRRHFGRDESDHKAFNSIIQGGAAELVKSKQLEIAREIDWDTCKMLLQVHDEIVFEISDPKWLTIIPEIMSDVGSLRSQFGQIPFPVEYKIWNSQKSVLSTV